MLLIGLTMVWLVCEALKEKAPIQYAQELLDDKAELNFHGNDILELFKEVEELLQYKEEGWYLGRVSARQVTNSKETMDYDNVYLYYKPEDVSETTYRRVRVLNENDTWYVAEVIQQDESHEQVHMDEPISEFMIEKIWGLAEEQAFICLLKADECGTSVTSKEVTITVYKKNDGNDKSIVNRLAFLIKHTEEGYQLEDFH